MCSATPTMAKYCMVGRYYDRWLQAHEPIDKMARRLNWRAIYVWTVTLARGHPWYWCRPYSSLRPRGINISTLIFNNLLYNDIIFNIPTHHAFRWYQRESDLEFVKKITRPNFRAKEFYSLKTCKSRLFSTAINSENASLSVIWPSFG